MKLNLKAVSEVLSAVKDYLFPYEKISKKFLKINKSFKIDKTINYRQIFSNQPSGYIKKK